MKISNYGYLVSIAVITNCFLFFFIISNYFTTIDKNILDIIEVNPLPNYYFPIFLIIGILIPAFYYLVIKISKYEKKLLSAYLCFVFLQIISEVLFVSISGKTSAVLIGLIFSILRVFQLSLFLLKAQLRINLRILIFLELILWSFNILQISINRVIPLIIFLK